MASLRMFKLQTFNNNRKRGMTNNDVYLTVWHLWSLILIPTGQTLEMVKEILNFSDDQWKWAKIECAVLLKDTSRIGSHKGVMHHHALTNLKLDLVGIHADPVLVPDILSRAQPHHGHCELKFNKKQMQAMRTMKTINSKTMLKNPFGCQLRVMQPIPKMNNSMWSRDNLQTFEILLNTKI